MIRFYKFKDGKLLKHQHSRPPKRCIRCGGVREAKGSNICKVCWESEWEIAHPLIGSLGEQYARPTN